MNQTPLNILQQYWKHDSFRPMQEEIIQAVLDGKDALALLPRTPFVSKTKSTSKDW